jgi:hypothetical protein
MILDHRFADTFTEQMLDISKLREDENIDEISRKIIDLCDLDLNFSSELLSRLMMLLVVSVSVIFGFIIVVWLIIMGTLIYLFVVASFSSSWSVWISDWILETIIVVLLFLIPSSFGFLMNKWMSSMNIAEKLKQNTINLYILCKNRPDDIDTILKQSQKVKWIISFIMTIERLKFIFSDASKEKIKTLVSIVISLGYMILMGLRSNLTLHLTEQKKNLQSAKLEIEENLVGNEEVFKASEMQKIRIDKQIQQFEKLQQRLI